MQICAFDRKKPQSKQQSRQTKNRHHYQAIDSRESVILQMQNVIMGAVGYKYNYRGSGTSSAKEAVISRIEQHLHHKIGRTSSAAQKFNVFVIDLREAD